MCIGAGVGIVAAPVIIPAGLHAIGFGAAGIGKGTLAAKFMSTFWGGMDQSCFLPFC